jgi:hypothetical protein
MRENRKKRSSHGESMGAREKRRSKEWDKSELG